MVFFLTVLAAFTLWAPSSMRLSLLRRSKSNLAIDRGMILDLAIAAFQAGHSIPGALEAVGQATEENLVTRQGEKRKLVEVSKSLLLGASWEEAWENTSSCYRELAAALEPAWSDGAAPVALLARSALTLRMTRARRAKEAAARLGARLVIPLATCFLPAFLLIGVFPVIVAAGEKIF